MKIIDTIQIPVNRQETDLDRACDQANRTAIAMFGIDEYGHSDRLDGWDRSSCWIEVEFVSYEAAGGMGGWNHRYTFTARAMKSEDS